MKVSTQALREVEQALAEWEREVAQAERNGWLEASTAKTYTGHPRHFVRWLSGDFIPGGRKSGKR